jgi:hypothetical protein
MTIAATLLLICAALLRSRQVRIWLAILLAHVSALVLDSVIREDDR